MPDPVVATRDTKMKTFEIWGAFCLSRENDAPKGSLQRPEQRASRTWSGCSHGCGRHDAGVGGVEHL